MTTSLQDKLTELAEAHGVPGAVAGIVKDGVATYAVHGVTSVENPLPVTEHTLFQTGSTGKTYTGTAIMRLVEQGRIDLDATVKTYLPELSLQDKDVEARVTVLQLLNHTSGWDGDVMTDTGLGDDALATYVGLLAGIQQVTPLGAGVSYNNAALAVAGRVIEKVTGLTFEQAVQELLFAPLGLTESFYFFDDIMTRRFVVGHEPGPDGDPVVRRPWGLPRSLAAAGGITSSVVDYLAWAAFHLGDGSAPDGTRVLKAETLQQMQTPTADMRGSALGDYVGISWLISDRDGKRVVEHGGTTNGQHSELALVPELGLGLVIITNSEPGGPQLIEELKTWVLAEHAGIAPEDDETVALGDDEIADYLGAFDTVAAVVEIVPGEQGQLEAHVSIKEAALATMREAGQEAPEQPPFVLAMLADKTRYVIPTGPAKGMRGYFSRDEAGRVDGVHLGGRLALRVAAGARG